MNQIDFLPPWYRQQQAQRRRDARQLAAAVVVVLLMLLGYSVERTRLADLRQRTETLEAEAIASDLKAKKYLQLLQRRGDLTHRLIIQRQLTQPISHTQVLATITQLTPPAVAISKLSVRTSPTVTEAAQRAKSKRKRKMRDGSKAEPSFIHIEITGLAPSDVEIADMLAKFNDSPLFDNLTLLYSRSVTLDTIIARQFRIEMQVSLDRDYQPPRSDDGGVARAG